MSLGPFRSNSTIENVTLPKIGGKISRNGHANKSALEGPKNGDISQLSGKRNSTNFAMSPLGS